MWLRFLMLLMLALVSSVVAAAPAVILVMGDSLSAGYGIEQSQGWVALLQQRLTAQGVNYAVVNASISGETTRGGLARLPQALQQHRPHIVLLALGANDGLRGLLTAEMEANLDAMMRSARNAGAQVVLIGMKLPPNYGKAYTERYTAVYATLAKRHRVPLVPFLLDGVATDFSLMQADGLHPTAAAQGRVLDNVWPVVRSMLK